MNNQQKEILARIFTYVLMNEESDYEEQVEALGREACKDHIYNLTRDAWAEFDLDYSDEETQVTLDARECQNLLDALEEWADSVGPKELSPDEIGLDEIRYNSLRNKLTCVERNTHE